MVLDYKDVRFSFAQRRFQRRKKIAKLALLALLSLAALLAWRYVLETRRIARVEKLLLAGDTAGADSALQARARYWFQARAGAELRALRHLLAGDLDSARADLEALGRPHRQSAISRLKFLGYFSDHARYRELRVYASYLAELGGDPLQWYRAQALTALGDVAGARRLLQQLGDAFRQENLKALRLLDKVNEQLASGRIAYVFDRRGQPLAEYDNRSGVSRSLVPGFSVADFVPSLQEGLRFFILGLDGSIQQKVHRLFNPYFGTFLLLDLEEGAILSAYSKSRQPQSPNPVFSDLYEPGSIVKVITLLGYLGAGPTPLFPFTCKGAEIIGNKIFYDALKHGVVEGAEQALAISCNLAFVRMGRSLGFAKLADTLGRFAFNGQDFSDLFITFRTGRFQSVGSDEYRLANLAVGLDELTLTTFHAALIAALVAQRGQVASPYLIDSVRNILNLGFVNHRVQVQRLLPAEWDFTTLQRAMAEVVASDKGTGRRARVAGVSLALKTGTAGSRAQGLDAVVIGFFPLEKPQYAFAVRLEGAGRAEFNGAFFVRDFLRSFYGD